MVRGLSRRLSRRRGRRPQARRRSLDLLQGVKGGRDLLVVEVVQGRDSRDVVSLDSHSIVCTIASVYAACHASHLNWQFPLLTSPTTASVKQCRESDESVSLSPLLQPAFLHKRQRVRYQFRDDSRSVNARKQSSALLHDRAGSDTCSPKLPQANPSISVRFHLSSTLSSSGTSTTLHGLLGDLGGSRSTLSLCG